MDRVFEHIYTLNREFDKARTGHFDKNVTWLDVSNAFGAIPHATLTSAIDNCGTRKGMLQILKDIYRHNVSSVSVAGRKTDINVR